MSEAVLAIDAGTTNVRSMLVGADGGVLSSSTSRLKRNHPAPGLVEQDPEEMWSAVEATTGQTLKRAGLRPVDIAAVGITGQRSTAIVWERATGKTLHPAVGWQDQRGNKRSFELVAQGFITVWPTTPAAKMEQILRAIPDGFKRMRRGELAWGNVDSYIAWRLSDGGVHVTDYSNAGGTGYFQYLGAWDWRDDLLEVQGLERSFFPRLVDSAGRIGMTSRRIFGSEVPIGAIIGDQQSATYAQGCLKPGQGKITFGTSATCDVNSGQELKLGAGSYPAILWRRGDQYCYCLEGMVFTAGAVFDWLTDLGFIESPAAAAAVASTVESSQGVFFLPSLQGQGTPHVDPERRGFFGGLTLGATAAHFVRAAMEGVAFRVREMVDQIYVDSELPLPEIMRVDGGAAANDGFLQLLADVLGRPIDRMQPLEATAYGAASLAGEACGLWEPWSVAQRRRSDCIFEPRWSKERRDGLFQWWKEACQL